jgi:formylglycine-generating enzyme required for sulfatase activity
MDVCMSEDFASHRKLIANTQPATHGVNSAGLGHLAVAAIVIGVALFLYFHGNGPAPGSALPLPKPAAPANLPGFRADAWLLPSDHLLGFVEIPAGPFTMGGDKSTDPLAFDNERWSPAQARGDIELPTFYIGRYEVTVAQYQAFVATTGRNLAPQTLASPLNHPVTYVSWPDALAYCRWLEAAMKASPITPASLKRRLDDGWHVTLPSEAEWEKAARGADGRRYPWGEEARRDRANLGGQGTVPVGSIACPECAYGLSDMSGNVWEWTRSPYQPYPYDPGDDSRTIGFDALWVMRGGAFNDGEQMARATTRGAADPGVRRPFIGFRIVLARN